MFGFKKVWERKKKIDLNYILIFDFIKILNYLICI